MKTHIRKPQEPSFALFGKTRNAVLNLFFSHPDESFYLREIIRAAGGSPGAVKRELGILERAGVLQRAARGHLVFYRANRECPVFAELERLVLKTSGAVEVLRAGLKPLGQKIRVAFIYGSLARGEQRRGSDVDLFVVGDADFAETVEALAASQEKLGREVNPSVYPVAEFRQKAAQGHHFIATVLREPKLFVVGDEIELAGLAGQRLDTRAPDQPGRN